MHPLLGLRVIKLLDPMDPKDNREIWRDSLHFATSRLKLPLISYNRITTISGILTTANPGIVGIN